MSAPQKKEKEDILHPYFHKKAIDGIVLASKFAREGKKNRAADEIKNTRVFVGAQVQFLRDKGEVKAADEYRSAADEHINRVENALKDPSKPIKKSDAAEIEASFAKAETPQLKGKAAEARAAENRGEAAGAKKVTATPKAEGYNYVPFHALTPSNQKAAHTKFGGADMHHYEYAVDVSGALAHTNRHLVGKAPRPTAEAYQSKSKPDFQVGTGVDIHSSSGLPHKFGIVRAPNPYFPGKVMVQHGPRLHETVAVDPAHLKEREPHTQLEKALSVSFDLKRQLGMLEA